MEPLRAILIDDELSSLQNLNQKLTEFCPDIKIVATAQQPEQAILLIRQHNPHVIFLDIEMPRMSGFRMLEELGGNYDFDIIFTTAYNHYAVEAIRISAFDYLTKPIAIKDLQNAVERLVKARQSLTKERLNLLKQSIAGIKSQEDKIALPLNNGLEFRVIRTIVHINSSSSYSTLFFVNGSSLLVTKPLRDFDEILVSYGFYRVHNSHLINLTQIKKYIRSDGGQVVMQNDAIINVSRRKKEDFLRLIGI